MILTASMLVITGVAEISHSGIWDKKKHLNVDWKREEADRELKEKSKVKRMREKMWVGAH